MRKLHWQDWLNLILVVWLFLSPVVIGAPLSGIAIANYYLVGIGLGFFSIGALIAFQRWEEWMNLILGAWLLVSPWVLDFTGVIIHLFNALVVGVLIVLIAGSALGEERGGRPVAK